MPAPQSSARPEAIPVELALRRNVLSPKVLRPLLRAAGRPGESGVAQENVSSAQPIFQLNRALCFIVAVLHDDWGVNREPPFSGLALLDGPRTGHDHCIFRNYERLVGVGSVDLLAHNVIHRSGTRKDHTRTQHSPRTHLGTFINSALPAHTH